MSQFYQSIAQNYDQVFPVRPAQVAFVAQRVLPEGRIVDVGCATGGLALALAERGFSLWGIDLDSTMIDIARANASAGGLGASFLVADMTRLDTAPIPCPVDGVVCLGNTLVHLTPSQVLDFLVCTRKMLTESGVLICQIVNYDRILKNDIRSLPLIENEAIRFERTYAPAATKEALRFQTRLYVKSTSAVLENEITLYPLDQAQLSASLAQAGFSRVAYFGSFMGDPFDSTQSFPTIFVAGC